MTPQPCGHDYVESRAQQSQNEPWTCSKTGKTYGMGAPKPVCCPGCGECLAHKDAHCATCLGADHCLTCKEANEA